VGQDGYDGFRGRAGRWGVRDEVGDAGDGSGCRELARYKNDGRVGTSRLERASGFQ
jgi:hypothetical protein